MAETPTIIHELVDRFHENRDQYMSAAYNEEQARMEFINLFFEALGWDVANKAGYSPAYMDVVFEGTMRTEDGGTAPDYTFRVGQTHKFFVEAKKPSASINFDPDHARQIRRYSWSAKLPIAILTNFGEFAVYDCRIPPKPSDKASFARLMYIRYTEYPTRWDEIAGIFSRDAVWKGSFDRYAESEKGKSGTAEVQLVDRMLDLHKQLDTASIPSEKTRIQRRIDATDREIDSLVYELYGLTDEEIRSYDSNEIVEGSA